MAQAHISRVEAHGRKTVRGMTTPAAFWMTIAGPKSWGFEASVLVNLVERGPVAVGILVRGTDGDAHSIREGLDRLNRVKPLSEWCVAGFALAMTEMAKDVFREAVEEAGVDPQAVVDSLDADDGKLDDLLDDVARTTVEALEKVSSPRRRRAITDELLQQVARSYAGVGQKATEHVAKTMNVSHRTASRYIAAARAANLLTEVKETP
jgi:hypothetical protein